MKLFKELTLDTSYWQLLQAQMQKSLDDFLLNRNHALLLNENNAHAHINKINKPFIHLSINDLPIYSYISEENFLKSVPLFEKFLYKNDLKINIVLLNISNQLKIHVDHSAKYKSFEDYNKNLPEIQTAICFPIYNTEDSITSFYEPYHSDAYYKKSDNKTILFEISNSIRKIDEFTLNKPTIMKITVPHGVHSTSNKPRAVYSIRFKRNPWELFHD
jgi:hypothetical protein